MRRFQSARDFRNKACEPALSRAIAVTIMVYCTQIGEGLSESLGISPSKPSSGNIYTQANPRMSMRGAMMTIAKKILLIDDDSDLR
jgi:hypothetical protein